jgi:HK97 family phage major capsid protein
MTRREALAKATVTTTVAAGGALSPSQSRAFLEVLMDSSAFGRAIRQEIRPTFDGEINKLATGTRLIRAAVENADDGYRVEPTFPDVQYATKKWRLPFEVTDDVYDSNIEGRALEASLVRRFGTQAGLDLDDLNINGDIAAGAGPDQAFLQIDDGLLKLLTTVAGVNRVNAATVDTGNLGKAILFDAQAAMPQKYLDAGNLVWLASGRLEAAYNEYLTNRSTAAGDSALNQTAQRPLGYPWLTVPFMPTSRLILTNPKNLVRVLFNGIKRYIVHPNQDWELATRDKHGYIFFGRQDFILETPQAIVDVYGLTGNPATGT